MDVVEKADFYEWWQENYSMANLAMGAAEEAWNTAAKLEQDRCVKTLIQTFAPDQGSSMDPRAVQAIRAIRGLQ